MKKKIVSLCLVICLIAIAIVGGSLAYFTDKGELTNTFTTGNVAIELTEALVEKVTDTAAANYGDMVAIDAVSQRTADNQEYGNLYPGQNIYKDPTIKNVGTENAYVAAKITVTSRGDLHSVLGAQGYDILALNEIISGGIEDEQFVQEYWNNIFGNNCASYFVYQKAVGNNTYELYFFIKNALAQNDTVTLFDTITIPDDWDNEEMDELKGLSIQVNAYATQEYGFADCYAAMKAAFPNDFNF